GAIGQARHRGQFVPVTPAGEHRVGERLGHDVVGTEREVLAVLLARAERKQDGAGADGRPVRRQPPAEELPFRHRYPMTSSKLTSSVSGRSWAIVRTVASRSTSNSANRSP